MENYSLEIPLLGALEIVFTDATHCHVSNPRGGVVKVRGVELRPSAHMFLWSDGRWHLGRETENTYQQGQHLSVTRANWTKVSDMYASQSARKKIASEFEVAVNNFALGNPAIIRAAQLEHLHDTMRRAEGKCAEAAQALLEAKTAQEAAQDAYEQFQLDGSAK